MNTKPPVKRLTPRQVEDVEKRNLQRRLAHVPPIRIKVLTCRGCHSLFESAGDTNCGCRRPIR